MSWSLRRTVLAFGAVVLFGTLAHVTQAQIGQKTEKQIEIKGPVPPPAQPKDPTEFSHAIELPRNPDMVKKIEAAQDYIKDADWETACELLQKLLMLDQDYFTKVPRKGLDGKETMSWVSLKAEADQLLANLPKEGMEWYKLTYGPKAAEYLKKAKDSGDVQQLTIITRFYLHTDAGAEATNLLGTYQLDRGQFTTAALCYEKLLKREESDKLSQATLVKAAWAFHMTGDKANENLCRQKLNSRLRDLRYGNETMTVDELFEFIAKSGHSFNDLVNFDTPMIGGGPSRSSQGIGGTAFLGSLDWRQSLIHVSGTNDTTLHWITAAENKLRERGQPMIPAMQPITATTMKDNQKQSYVIYTDHLGIRAVDLMTGKMKWNAPSSWSMDRMAHDMKKVGALTGWIGPPQNQQMGHLSLRPNILVENSTVGTLSSDGTFVYKIEDLEIPPTPSMYNQFDPRGGQVNYGVNKDVADAIAASKLQAYDLITGKLKWEVGGNKSGADEKDDLKDSYFLGPPMPMGGKLYVLLEKQQDLRLASLDPVTGKLLNIQTLATAKDKMMQDVWRRIQAVHLAYGEGILVCPTNAGAVLGVDLLSNSLVWAYPYRDKSQGGAPPPDENPGMPRRGIRMGGPQRGPGWQMGPEGWFNPDMNTQWKVSPPVIVEGKVVFTAPDANRIHCINLRDGAAVWSDKRGADDLYLAGVFSGKALIVGKNYVRALSLTKGQEVWRVATGMPSGYGVASDNVYYLPLQEGTGQEKDPGIFAIDINKGQRIAYNKSREKQTVGNLLFYDGKVLSQSATELIAFPQLAVQLVTINERLSKDPNDPKGLFERGQMRLDKGDLSGAIDDLRRSLRNHPPEDKVSQVREKLYDSFTEFFQKDFNQAEQFLKEYEELCKVGPVTGETEEAKAQLKEQQRRRRANFLCLVAKGKADQGKLVEAYEKYQEFTAEAGEQKLVSVVDEPFVKATPEVWSGGRIAAMVAKATPENRKPLEEVINKKWDELKQSDDLKEIRKFARMFGALFPAGKEARLELANRLMDDASPTAMLEAEQQLSLLRLHGEDPQMAARAVEALARLNTRKGLLEDACYYYRLLRDQYGKVPVRDGKTGAELFDDMATDKRLLPYLDLPASLHISGKKITSVQEVIGNNPPVQQFYEFAQVGEKLPFFQRNRLGLRTDYHELKIIDRITHEQKVSKLLDKTNFQMMIRGNIPNLPQFTYQTQGHLVVLPVAHRVFGIDPLHGEVLWSWNLFGDASAGSGQPDPNMVNLNQFVVDPKDNSLLVTYQDNWVLRIGGGGSLAGDAVVLRTREGLVALDPLSGKPLWTRANHLSNCHLFNDDQYVYMVEMDSAGNPSSTHVLRACDGTSVPAPNFAAQYQKRVRLLGRNMLLADTDAKGQLVYRLYDVLTGKDVWTAAYPATPSTHVLKSEDENFAGVIETDGTVHVLDVHTGKQVLKTKMDPQYLQKIDSVHLLYDGRYFFVACHDKIDATVNPWGITTNLMPGTGMRGLPVNGPVYCFDAQTGKTKWRNTLQNQMIVLDHFADMPILLATSRYQQWAVPNRQVQSVVVVEAFEKYSGKSLYEKRDPGWAQFHALNLDPRKGTVEFVNYNAKITFVAPNE